jgi:cystathionine beta-lyase/cystathionine gamma-synthase
MENFVHSLKCFLIAVSWGGHESLIMPTIGFYNIRGNEHNPIVPWNTVRFYIGLEDADWLIADIKEAIKQL